MSRPLRTGVRVGVAGCTGKKVDDMGLGRLGIGKRIAGASAILLFVLMFFHRFGSTDSGELRLCSVGRNAWEALDATPIVLLITIAVAFGVVGLRMMGRAYRFSVQVDAIIACLGTASSGLIVFRIVEPPTFGSVRDTFII